MTSNCAFSLEPLAVSELTAMSNLPSLNYTNQDFHSMKTRLVKFIQEKFVTDFTDFVEGDLAIMLIENWAFIADTLSFKMDQIVNELFIDTVVELENAFRLSRLVGFLPTPPVAAKAMFSATIQTPLVTDLVIPAALRFDVATQGQPLSYELFPSDAENNPIFEQDIVIPAGDITNTSVVGLEGETRVDSFSSNGTINQTYTLTITPVLFDSVAVDVDGQRWEKVDFFTDSKGRNEYRVEFDSTWTGFVIFGNGSAGRSPTIGSQVTVTYRTGGGTRGNVITGFVEGQRGFEVPGFNFSVPVTFRNYTKADFGYDGDTIDDIRRKLPRYIKTQDRAVTGEDYKTLTDQFVSPYNGQVGKSLAVLRNYGCVANIVDLYVLVKDGTDGLQEASDQFKSELSDYMGTKKMMTDFLCIRDGVVLPVDVILDVTIDKFFKKFKEEIQNKISIRITDFFTLSNWEYGKTLKNTEVMRTLSDIREIKDVFVTFTTSDDSNSGSAVTAKYFEIIRNDTVTINLMFE
jgi:hypothetical protein